MEIILILWVGSMIVGSFTYGFKGFLLGFFFSILGAVIAIVMGGNAKERDRKDREHREFMMALAAQNKR